MRDPRFDPPWHPWEPEEETEEAPPPDWVQFVIVYGVPAFIALVVLYVLVARTQNQLDQLRFTIEQLERSLR